MSAINRKVKSMEALLVPRNDVRFIRSGSEESSRSRDFRVPRSSWEGLHPT